MFETQLADEAPASPPAPRGQRAGGPPVPEGITTIGQGVVIEGEVKGGEDLVIDGKVDGTIELPQHVLTVGPTGRVKAQLSAKSVVVLGKVSGSIQASELVRILGDRRDRLGRRCDCGSAVGCGGRCGLAGPRGRVGLGRGSLISPPARPRPFQGYDVRCVSELPSVALTQRFLALCEHHGSQHLVVKLVAVGRGTGVAGLPESDDWTTWDAAQMRAAVEYLEHLRVR